MSDAESKDSAATAAPPEGEAAAETASTDSAGSEEAKAEETPAKSEETPEAKAEETPEAKAEETPEAKAEETPAKSEETPEAKAEETPAAKAEETPAKAEETPAAKSAIGGHKKGKKPPEQKTKPKEKKAETPLVPTPPKQKKERTARLGEEEEKAPQDLLLENIHLVVLVCVVFSLIPVAWKYYSQTASEDSVEAWSAYGKASDEDLGKADFKKLVREHGNTTAAPYIKIKWAAKLYETGERDKVVQARDLLKEVKRDFSYLDLVAQHVEPQIEKIEAELADPRVVWAEAGSSSVAPPTSGS